MRARERRFATLVLLSLAAGLALGWLHAGMREQTRAASPAPVSPVALSPARAAPAVEARPVADQQRDALPACIVQPLLLDGADGLQHACAGGSRSQRSGSLTTHRFDLSDGRWLEIGVAGGSVAAIALGGGPQDVMACQPCSGASIDDPDLQGVRTMVLTQVALGVARLSGSLKTSADSGLAEADPACAGQDLLVNGSNGRSRHFCPGDGAAVERSDDGGYAYRFASSDGALLLVELGADLAVRRIAFADLQCTAGECAGVTLGPADAGGTRLLRLDGTLLQRQGLSSSLIGSLWLPTW